MEDVLEVYHCPYAENEVLGCMDDTSKQQVKETGVSRSAAPGAVSAYDYEYGRNGVVSLFMLFAPLEGGRSDRPPSACPFRHLLKVPHQSGTIPTSNLQAGITEC